MKIYQIYYNEESKKNCLDFAIPYFNDVCTQSFENQVIVNLWGQNEHIGSNYFGVWSHKFKHKIPKFDYQKFIEFVECNPSDFYSFFPSKKSEDIIRDKNCAQAKTLQILFDFLKININVEKTPTKIYCLFNFWIMKEKVFSDYVSSFLLPAINAIPLIPEMNKRFPYSFEKIRFKENPKLKEQIGNYTIAPFVLELLPSYYATYKNLQCTHFQ